MRLQNGKVQLFFPCCPKPDSNLRIQEYLINHKQNNKNQSVIREAQNKIYKKYMI